MSETEKPVNNDYHSIFVSVGAFYPHHVGYEIHTLPLDMLEDQKSGSGRAVQGSHTLKLEGVVIEHGKTKEPRQACDITITDVSTAHINTAAGDKHAYIGSVRFGESRNISAIISVKPAIVRDVLSLFYSRSVDAQYQLKRAVIVRLDIATTSEGSGSNERFKILRIGFE